MLNGLGTNLQTSVSMCMHRRGKANITEQPQIGIRVVKFPTGWWIVVVHYCVYKGHGVDNNWIPLGCIPQPLLHTQSNSPNVAFTLFGGSASARHQPCTQSSRNETHLKGVHCLSTSARGWGGQRCQPLGRLHVYSMLNLFGQWARALCLLCFPYGVIRHGSPCGGALCMPGAIGHQPPP